MQDYDSTGSASSVLLKMDGEKLVLRVSTVGYDDFFAAGGQYKPGICDSESVFAISGGKLRVGEVEHNFYIDLPTSKRIPTGEPVELASEQVD
jgi:hypothetical protein